jgi:epsilon-lactone hydrolase
MIDEMDAVRALLENRLPQSAPLAERRAQMDAFGALAPLPPNWTVVPTQLGRPAEHHSAPELSASRAILYLHGGGYSVGSPASHRGLVAQLAAAAKAQAFALDYRLAPEHPCPAALEDAVNAFKALLERGFAPGAIALAGDSAGGGLALATAQHLLAEGAALPAAVFMISPWLNLAQEGASYDRRAAYDPVLTKAELDVYAAAYLAGRDAKDPIASPLFGPFEGLPPCLVQVGSEEILLSDAEAYVQHARAAGLDFSLEVWPRMIHVWHAFYPMLTNGREATEFVGGWLQRRWAKAGA